MPHPATPESFAHYSAMQEATHYLPINQLEDGCAYLIHARNSYIGIWRASDNAFVLLREKLGRLFLFPEFHWDTGAPFGTAKPFIKISGPGPVTREALDDLHARITYADYMAQTAKRPWADIDSWLAAQPVRSDRNLAAMISEDRDERSRLPRSCRGLCSRVRP